MSESFVIHKNLVSKPLWESRCNSSEKQNVNWNKAQHVLRWMIKIDMKKKTTFAYEFMAYSLFQHKKFCLHSSQISHEMWKKGRCYLSFDMLAMDDWIYCNTVPSLSAAWQIRLLTNHSCYDKHLQGILKGCDVDLKWMKRESKKPQGNHVGWCLSLCSRRCRISFFINYLCISWDFGGCLWLTEHYHELCLPIYNPFTQVLTRSPSFMVQLRIIP